MQDNLVKFPYTVARRAHARKPRRSKNGTPEERAACAAADEYGKTLRAEIDAGQNEVIRSAQMREFGRLIGSLHPSRYPEALGALRTMVEKGSR